MRAINERADFKVDGLPIGSGNAGDKQTIEWTNKWYKSGKPWPWFIKRSFRTIWKLEGKKEAQRKISPPIRDEILSEEFVEEFNKGHLSAQSLSLVCPDCGSVIRNARFAIYDKNGRRVSELMDKETAHFRRLVSLRRPKPDEQQTPQKERNGGRGPEDSTGREVIDPGRLSDTYPPLSTTHFLSFFIASQPLLTICSQTSDCCGTCFLGFAVSTTGTLRRALNFRAAANRFRPASRLTPGPLS